MFEREPCDPELAQALSRFLPQTSRKATAQEGVNKMPLIDTGEGSVVQPEVVTGIWCGQPL